VAALDDWLGEERDAATRQWVAEVLGQVDPHPWRTRFRQARLRRDTDEVRRMAADAPVGELSPIVLVGVASALPPGSPAAIRPLPPAARRLPGDFQLHYHLGMQLGNALPPRKEGAIEHLRVAAALRPGSIGAWINLGVALRRADRQAEGLAALRRAAE